VVTAAVRGALGRLAAAHPRIVFWADSRLRSELFRGVIVKGNQAEIDGASTRALGRVDYFEFRRHVAAPLLAITAGGHGALIVEADRQAWARARSVARPVDICGAGDAFSAGAVLALKATGDPVAAASFGNLVASITIMKKGTGTASPHEVVGRSLSE